MPRLRRKVAIWSCWEDKTGKLTDKARGFDGFLRATAMPEIAVTFPLMVHEFFST
jgi:hypothetical protein